MFFLETFSPTLATLILTVFKTTQVALPTLISLLTLLEPFSYFIYGVIDSFKDSFFFHSIHPPPYLNFHYGGQHCDLGHDSASC
jgi:hypothetical protein